MRARSISCKRRTRTLPGTCSLTVLSLQALLCIAPHYIVLTRGLVDGAHGGHLPVNAAEHSSLHSQRRIHEAYHPFAGTATTRQLDEQQCTHVADALGLLAALRESGTARICIGGAGISLDSPTWRSLTAPVVVTRDVLLLGGGRYAASGDATSPTGPYHILDFGHLSGKVHLFTQGNGTASRRPLLAFQGLWLRNHLPPTGYGLSILSSSAESAIVYADCVLERDVGIPLTSSAVEARMVVGNTTNVTLAAGAWCPPASATDSTTGTSCFRNGVIIYGNFTTVLSGAAAPLDSTTSPSALAPTSTGNMPPILVTLSNCTYGVQHEVSQACVDAYGPDFCVHQLRAALQQAGGATGGGMSAGAGAGIAVAATLVACLALFLTARFLSRVRGGHRTLTLAVRPPGATSMTTLLVTDIQSSTNLWEQLPTAVMNEALRLHHKCLRSLLLKNNGYESATEGDSFILAFHTPMDAARFALMAQHALMELPWPAELLNHEDGCEVWAEPAKPRVVRGAVQQALAWGPGLASTVGTHHGYANIAEDESEDDDATAVLYDTQGNGHAQHWWLPSSVGSPSRPGSRRTGSGRVPSNAALRKPLAPRPSTSERPFPGPHGGGAQHVLEGDTTLPGGEAPGASEPGAEPSPFTSTDIVAAAKVRVGARPSDEVLVTREHTAPSLPVCPGAPVHTARGTSFDSRLPHRALSRATGYAGLSSRISSDRPSGPDGSDGTGAAGLLSSLTLRLMSRSNSTRVSATDVATADATVDGGSVVFPRWKWARGTRARSGTGTAAEADVFAWTRNPIAALAIGNLTVPAAGPEEGLGGAGGDLQAAGAACAASNGAAGPAPYTVAAASAAANASKHERPPGLMAPPSPPSPPLAARCQQLAAWKLDNPRLQHSPGAGPVAEGVDERRSPPLHMKLGATLDAQASDPSATGGHAVACASLPVAGRRALLPSLSLGRSSAAPVVPSRLGPRHATQQSSSPTPPLEQDSTSNALTRQLRSGELVVDGDPLSTAPSRHVSADVAAASATADLQLQQLLLTSGELLNSAATTELIAILQSATGSSAGRALPGPDAGDRLGAVAALRSPTARAAPARAMSEKGGMMRKHLSEESATAQASARPLAAPVGHFVSSTAANRQTYMAGVFRRGLPAGHAGTVVGPQWSERSETRNRAHTYHGYQQAAGHAVQAPALQLHPQHQLLQRHGHGSGNLTYSRTQAIEMVPMPVKLPEIRQTWREMCASHWLLLPSPRDAGRGPSSTSLGHNSTCGPLEPHPEADGDEDELHTHPPRCPSADQHHHHSCSHHADGGLSSRQNKATVLLFRGMRVRMGLHTGITLTTDVTFNHTTGHMAYSGMPLKVAKAVGDGAAGGSVLLSNTTFNFVHPHLADLPGHARLLYCGDAQVELVIRSLYMLVARDMQPRLGHLPALRNLRMLQLGNFEAPVGTVAICFMVVSGATKAVAELGQPAVTALQEFKSIVTYECRQCGGFVVEATDGLCLAAFMEPAAAAAWALRAKEALTAHSWSREVLASPHFREVRETTKQVRGRSLPSRRGAHVVSRGPRTRCGIAVGPVTVEVSAATARLAYRGKVMNRSARVAAQAADNQVLLSHAAWRRVVETVGVHALADTLPQQKETLHWQASGASSPSTGLLHATAASGAAAQPPGANAANITSGGAGGCAGNLLLAAAEQLLCSAAEESDGEELEALLAAAAVACAGLPELPAGFVLGGSSAGVFTLKGVAEPQELFELHLAPPPLPASGAALSHSASLAGSRRPSFAMRVLPPLSRSAVAPGQQPPVASALAAQAAASPAVSHTRQPMSLHDGAASLGGNAGCSLAPVPSAARLSDAPAGLGGNCELACATSADISGLDAFAEGSAEQRPSREASVMGKLEPAELAHLRALAAGAEQGPGGAAAGVTAGQRADAAPAAASAQPPSATDLRAAGPPQSDDALIQAVRSEGMAAAEAPAKKPLAGDALLEALVQAALGTSDE